MVVIADVVLFLLIVFRKPHSEKMMTVIEAADALVNVTCMVLLLMISDDQTDGDNDIAVMLIYLQFVAFAINVIGYVYDVNKLSKKLVDKFSKRGSKTDDLAMQQLTATLNIESGMESVPLEVMNTTTSESYTPVPETSSVGLSSQSDANTTVINAYSFDDDNTPST